MMYYIYKIENLVNHKKYIGLTNNIPRRKNRHFSDLRHNRHDNSFLQKEFNIFLEKNFSFEVIYSGDVTEKQIGDKEKYYIQYYDSYRNGYNQNEGGNFGPSNGGSHLTQIDIYYILSALEFMSRPGKVLSDTFGVTTTTISRIKKGVNHLQYIQKYKSLPLEERKKIYNDFCQLTNFIEKKYNSTIIKQKRKLTKEQVFEILINSEYKITTKEDMRRLCNLKSGYTIECIIKGESYKDYKYEYDNYLTLEEKQKIVSQLRNKLK